MAELDTNMDPAKKGSEEFNKLETYGDLKKLIKSIASDQKIGNIKSQGKSFAIDQLLGFFPGASNAKTAIDFVKAAVKKPDTKKSGTWLDKLDIDDEMSAIVDDTVENGFMQAMAKSIEQESDTTPLEPDFNMNAKMVNYLKQQYGGRTVAGIKENKNMTLKEYIKSLTQEVLDEMTGTVAIGVGAGPIMTPNWVAPKGQKKNAATKTAEKQGFTVTKGETEMPADSKVKDYVSLTGKKKKKVKIYKESDYDKASSQYGAKSQYGAASKYSMGESITNIVKNELLNEVTYHKFKNEVKFRTKNEQLHKAIREVKRKLMEIDRIVEYTSRMKQELSEGDGIQYWKATQKNVATISEMVNTLNNKIKNLQQ
jgi:hypothetical protein